MGIPMFREPSPEAPKNNLAKDPSAVARSSIRRRAVRRPSRYNSSTTRGSFHRPAEGGQQEFGIERRTRSPLPHYSIDPTNSSTNSSRHDAGRRLLGEVIHSSHPGRRLRLAREPTVNPDRSGSPSFSWNFLRSLSPGLDSADRQASEHAPFTPYFAPAIAYHSTILPHTRRDGTRSPFPRIDGANDAVPQLRRSGGRSVSEARRQHHEPVLDGLGDRQRSLSPDEDHANDAWEMLLTTIAPDANLPTAESSFTSASASASTNASRNASSRATVNSLQTLPSSLDSSSLRMSTGPDPHRDYLNCDYTSDSDTESEPEPSSILRRYGPRIHLVSSTRRSPGPESTMGSQPPIPMVSLSFQHPSSDPDTQQMQAILDRLARREDIPDDWWAAAGLSHILGRRFGVGDDARSAYNTEGSLQER